jgi:hypothetical protein
VTAAVSQAVSARMASRRSLEAGLPLLLVTLAALESALFAKTLWLFVVGTLAGGVAVGFIFRGGLSELNRLAQPQHRAAVVSTFFVAAYVGLGLPAVLTGLISLPLGPVDASAWVSGLAAAAVALAFLVVLRSFGTAAGPQPAARPCDSWCSPAEPVRSSAPSQYHLIFLQSADHAVGSQHRFPLTRRPGSSPRTAEHAGYWGAQGKDLGAQVGEAGVGQQGLDFAGGAVGGARRGAGAAGLGRDGHAAAGCEPTAQLGEPLAGGRPEPEGVDGQDRVEGAVEGGWKLVGRSPDQRDPAGPDGGGVAPGRLPEHDTGVIDAVHVTGAGPGQCGDRHAGAEAELKDLVGGQDIEQ